jgi:hypothetical protein
MAISYLNIENHSLLFCLLESFKYKQKFILVNRSSTNCKRIKTDEHESSTNPVK